MTNCPDGVPLANTFVPFDHYDVQKSLDGEFPRGKKPHLVPTTIKLA